MSNFAAPEAHILQTPLHAWHASHGGRMVEFGGWSMPVQYSNIVAEHQATRTAIGLFDISHMGRLRFVGEPACEFLNSLVTKDVTKVGPGRIRYALMCRDDGGILDDVLVYHLRDGGGQPYYMLVVNAGNRLKIVDWIQRHVRTFAKKDDLDWFDLTREWAMLAVQGPKALGLLQPLVDCDLASMKYYSGQEASIAGYGGVVSRTGYTGEDGFEVMLGSAAAADLWSKLFAAGQPLGLLPAGLGCRDTLRLEAAMPLYGHELTEEINPIQAGLEFAVDLNKSDYPGREILAKAKADDTLPRRVGLDVDGKRIPRQDCPIIASATGGKQVGFVTSGTFSPTLNRTIAMGYIDPAHAALGTPLGVDIRGNVTPAKVVPLPFYKRA